MEVLKKHNETRAKENRNLKITNAVLLILYSGALVYGCFQLPSTIFASSAVLLGSALASLYCFCKIAREMKGMRQVLPNKKTFIVHAVNFVMSTLVVGTLMYAIFNVALMANVA